MELTKERREMANDHRKTWFVLTANNEGGWNWSQPMVRELAYRQYDVQKTRMPNCPAKLVCVEEVHIYWGDRQGSDRQAFHGIGAIEGVR